MERGFSERPASRGHGRGASRPSRPVSTLARVVSERWRAKVSALLWVAGGRLAPIFLLSLVLPAAQAIVFWSGTLEGTDPTFNRPANMSGLSFSATDVHYDVQPFYVSAPGDYVFESGQNFDGFVLVYGGSFDPASAMLGLLGGGDDFTPDPFSPNPSERNELIDPWGYDFGSKLDSVVNGFGLMALSSGVQYFAVTTTFSNSATGNYFNALGGGPGVVNLGVVPEPSALTFLVAYVITCTSRQILPKILQKAK